MDNAILWSINTGAAVVQLDLRVCLIEVTIFWQRNAMSIHLFYSSSGHACTEWNSHSTHGRVEHTTNMRERPVPGPSDALSCHENMENSLFFRGDFGGGAAGTTKKKKNSQKTSH